LDSTEDENAKAVGEGAEQEKEEDVVILVSHARVHPGAVVVEPLNAAVANSTMPRSRSSYDFAVRAELDRINERHELKEVHLRVLLDVAGVETHSPDPENHTEHTQASHRVDISELATDREEEEHQRRIVDHHEEEEVPRHLPRPRNLLLRCLQHQAVAPAASPLEHRY